MPETESILTTLQFANRIMNLKPDEMQVNITVLAVLKKAKQTKKWDIASEWVDKVNQETLNKNLFVVDEKETKWSNYLVWQKHKISCLIYQGKYREALERLENIRNEVAKVEKYFLILEADALNGIGEKMKALAILQKLARSPKSDSWIVHRLAQALMEVGKKEEALKEMYRAMNLSYRLENSINVLKDIFLLEKDLGQNEEAYYHLLLYKLIREKNGWSVHEKINQNLNTLSSELNGEKVYKYHDVLRRCREYWKGIDKKQLYETKLESKKALKGKLNQLREDRPFCFIKTPTDSFFCYKSEIKGEIVEGSTVKFDIVPSFDKKKNQESWKAVNVVTIQ